MSDGKARALAKAWRAEARAVSAGALADSVRAVLEAAAVEHSDILAALEADAARKTAAAKKAALAVVVRWPGIAGCVLEVAT